MSNKVFTKSIEKWVKATKENADQAVRKIAFGLLSNFVVASPVDTGRFRGNWQVGLGSRPEGTYDVQEQEPVAREGVKLKAAGVGMTIYIANNLPYALPLEYGHSQQAPRGIVRVTIRRLNEIVKDVNK